MEGIRDLGKVSVRPAGFWDRNKNYERIDIVTDEETNESFIAKVDVPKGINLNNIDYWMPIGSMKGIENNGVLIIRDIDEFTGNLKLYTLEEAIKSIDKYDRKVGLIIEFYGRDFGSLNPSDNTWYLYQFNDDDINNFENPHSWVSIYNNVNKYKGYFIDEDQLKLNVPYPTAGDYAYVGVNLEDAILYACVKNHEWFRTNTKALLFANMYEAIYSKDFDEFDAIIDERYADRAEKDALGRIIHFTYATKDGLSAAIIENVNSVLANIELPDECVSIENLDPSLRDFIASGGAVENMADEEDLTSVVVGNPLVRTDAVVRVLKFKDKAYSPEKYSGMGRVYLRKNMIDGINVLTNDMFPSTDTIYIVQYSYDLKGMTITIPNNSILQFEGGSFNNGAIVLNSTKVVGKNYQHEIGHTLRLLGTYTPGQQFMDELQNIPIWWTGTTWITKNFTNIEVINSILESKANKTDVSIALDTKVDKIEGKGLSANDFTDIFKAKLESLYNYDDTAINQRITDVANRFDTLLNTDVSSAIDTYNEIVKFLENISDNENLSSILITIDEKITNVNNALNEYKNSNNNAVNILDNRLTTAETNITNNSTNINNLNDKFEDYKTSNNTNIDTIKNRLDEAESNINSGNSNTSQLDNRLTIAETDIDNLETNLNTVDNKVDTNKESIDTINSNIDNINSTIISITNRVTTNEEDIDILEIKTDELLVNKADDKKLVSEVDRLDKLKADKSTMESELTEIKNAASALTDRVTTAENNIISNDNDITTINNALDVVDNRLDAAESNIISNDADIAANTAAIAKNANDIASNDADITNLSNIKADKTTVTAELATKVDKIDGKGLSTNDYTNEEKEKLGDLPTNANLDAILDTKANKTDVATSLNTKVDKIAGKGLSTNDFDNDFKTKLTNLPNNDSLTSSLNLKADKTTVANQLDTKVDKITGKGLSTEDFTTAFKAKLESLNNYDDTSLDTKITNLTNQFNTLLNTDSSSAIDTYNEIVAFLDGISDETSLTSIVTGIESKITALTNRVSTNESSISSLSSNKVDKVSGKQLSTNDFTNEYKTKLTNLPDATTLNSTIATKANTSDVNASLNTKVDKVTGKGLSTNDFTTDEKNKLAGIAAGANNYSLPTASSTTKGGVKVGSGLTITNEILGVNLSKSHIPSLSWNKITSGKPTTLAGYGITDAYTINAADNRFSLKGHVHDQYLTIENAASIYAKKTDIPSLAGYATQTWVQQQGYLTSHQSLANYYTKSETDNRYVNVTGDVIDGVLVINNSIHDTPMTLNAADSNNCYIQMKAGDVSLGYYGASSNNPIWYKSGTNNTIWHSGNDGSGSGLDADTLDGYHASSFLTSQTFISSINPNNYINVRFSTEDANHYAGTKYIEWCDSKSQWFNFAVGNLLANGTIKGTSIIKADGTASQFLKADGSVDNNSYALSNHTHSQYLTSHQSVSNKAAKLAWNTSTIIAAIGGTNITVALPTNPVTKTAIESVLTGNITTHTHSQYLTSHQSLSNYYTKSQVDSLISSSVPTDYVDKYTDQTIASHKTFSNGISVQGLSVNESADISNFQTEVLYLKNTNGTSAGISFSGNNGNQSILCGVLKADTSGNLYWKTYDIITSNNLQYNIESLSSLNAKLINFPTMDTSGSIEGETIIALGNNYNILRSPNGFYIGAVSSTAPNNITFDCSNGTITCKRIKTATSTLSIGDNASKINIGNNTTSPYFLNVAGDGFFTEYVICKGIDELSDIRFKTNIENINISIEDIANAPLIKFNYKKKKSTVDDNINIDELTDDDYEVTDNIGVGSTAQYWENILPEIVTSSNALPKTLRYSQLATIIGIQDAKEIIELKQEINSLKSQIEELKTIVNNLISSK